MAGEGKRMVLRPRVMGKLKNMIQKLLHKQLKKQLWDRYPAVPGLGYFGVLPGELRNKVYSYVADLTAHVHHYEIACPEKCPLEAFSECNSTLRGEIKRWISYYSGHPRTFGSYNWQRLSMRTYAPSNLRLIIDLRSLTQREAFHRFQNFTINYPFVRELKRVAFVLNIRSKTLSDDLEMLERVGRLLGSPNLLSRIRFSQGRFTIVADIGETPSQIWRIILTERATDGKWRDKWRMLKLKWMIESRE